MAESSPRADPSDGDPRKLVGQVISGRYRIEEMIGEGGMGAVYRAEHTNMRKRLAVKVLHPGMAQWSEAVERFEREAIAGAHIEHPNVAAATDFGVLDDGAHFLVMEFLQGEDLRSVIGRGPLLPERAVKNIARQIAMALRAAHAIGIVHRDLKPENVMLVRRDRESDVVKVLDFGIAKVPVEDLKGSAGTALTKLGMVYGTPEYMAPEQALGEEIDHRADLYSLGVVFYEMLCGLQPSEADSRVVLLGMVATRTPPSLRERVPGTVVPPELEQIAMRLLQKSRSDRFDTAEAALEAMEIAILELDYRLGAASPKGFRGSMHEVVVASAEGDPAARASIDRIGPTELAGRTAPPLARLTLLGQRAVTSLADRTDSIAGRTPLRQLPRPARLLSAGALAIVALLAGVVALRPDDSVTALAPEAPRDAPAPEGSAVGRWSWPKWTKKEASREEIDEAKLGGVAALTALAEKYPEDAAVQEALMNTHARAPSGVVAALGVAKRLLEQKPESATDEDLRRLVRRGAEGTPEASTLAFELMQERMGPHGPDLLYEIAWGDASKAKDRASKAMKDPVVLAKATPALKVAEQLREAKACKDKKPLLSRAAEDGDERSVSILAPLIVAGGRGCGFFGMGTCPAKCGTMAAEIKETIAAIEARKR